MALIAIGHHTLSHSDVSIPEVLYLLSVGSPFFKDIR